MKVNSEVWYVNGVSLHLEREEAYIGASTSADNLALRIGDAVQHHFEHMGVFEHVGADINGQKMDNLTERLRKRLWSKLTERTNICIIAHSNGTRLVNAALQQLHGRGHGQLLKQHVWVYGFGGVVILPKKLGFSVKNYRWERDLLALAAGSMTVLHETEKGPLKIQKKPTVEERTWQDASSVSADEYDLTVGKGFNPPNLIESHGFDSAYLVPATNAVGQFKADLRERKTAKEITVAFLITAYIVWGGIKRLAEANGEHTNDD